MKRKFTIRFTVISLFVLTTLLVTGVAIALQYYFSKEHVLKQTLFEYRDIVQRVNSDMHRLDDSLVHSTEILSKIGGSLNQFEDEKLIRDIFIHLLEGSKDFYSVYVGKKNGHFFQVINLEAIEGLRKKLGASSVDRWAVITVSPETKTREIQFYTNRTNFMI